ncbi:MAG: hypothetical protein A2Z18_01630 [Armatimonadetes bacterium RBG_16_58_9]|nr:MAG: hypothetical protein A2Z18_01630 [Armatimonadetes bacterium RBG_16_58_9]
MDDKRIEELLRGSWQVQPPDGMRDRVLSRVRRNLANERSSPSILGMNRWSAALASLGIVLVVLTNVSDHFRHERVAAMMGAASQGISRPVRDGKTLLELRRELDDLLARVPDDYPQPAEPKRGEAE